MKVWKKNLVAAAVLVTVCAGIYVNWMYTEEKAADNLTDTLDYEKVMSDESMVLSDGRRLFCCCAPIPSASQGQCR